MKLKHRYKDWQGRHQIYGKRNHPRSYAAYIKLKRWLLNMERISAVDTWMKFRHEYLTAKEKEGPLTCAYCNKTNLIAYTQDTQRLATVDHIVPIARGGQRFDVNNLCVACESCNRRKGCKSVEEFRKTPTNVSTLVQA